ncbi:uncharacterized protein PGTG_19828 [Puccinia graminis f. sp. tritici CRL 75-36-700-3]|uniref:Uncharacterized protein n=1 Tax=Puccinia graminis f. sp. tritici (strain CRL 75-36-700-3 / race SCCL) TaxID=418459 RepID=E3LB92_PUCGT|nr:uncharacterized protein PGTG_19828 [Puccinia graminis f. sp. tritici CRL 75-36-700-3]EFP93817.1 hypothetical protein PGTG_19828 [Puccinia graminis f. sp. tritici CRL 75-36-700-3]
MADAEGSSRASVRQALVDLSVKYQFAADNAASDWQDEEREPTEDDRTRKIEVFDKLHSSLLPSIKHHLSCLVTSLDLEHRPSNHPTPNLGLTLETLSSLDHTLDQIIVDFGHLHVPLPPVAHDHPLDRCKRFRSDQLISNISDLIQDPIRSTFLYCSDFIQLWELSTDQPESIGLQTSVSYSAETVLDGITEATNLVNKILRFSQLSDLDILQEQWQEKAESLDGILEGLTELTNSAIGHRRPLSAVRKSMLNETRLDITLVKLLRTLYDKVSKPTIKKLAFKLDPDVDSESLSIMHTAPETTDGSLLIHLHFLLENFKNDQSNGETADRKISKSRISRRAESMLLPIGLYLIPLPSSVDHHSSPARDFKAWLIMWQTLWHTAINRY